MAKNTSNATELRKLGTDELREKLAEAKEELFNLRFQGATGQLESHGRLRSVRRDIARIYTVQRERELGITESVEPAEAAATGDSAAEAKDEKQTEGVA